MLIGQYCTADAGTSRRRLFLERLLTLFFPPTLLLQSHLKRRHLCLTSSSPSSSTSSPPPSFRFVASCHSLPPLLESFFAIVLYIPYLPSRRSCLDLLNACNWFAGEQFLFILLHLKLVFRRLVRDCHRYNLSALHASQLSQIMCGHGD